MRILMILFPEAAPARKEAAPAATLEGAASPYYVFRDAGIEVVLASSEGGPTRLDEVGLPNSAPEVSRLKQDRSALDAFADTLRLEQTYIEDFDGAYCVGRPDNLGPTSEAKHGGTVLAEFLAAGKPVAMTPPRTDGGLQEIAEGLILIGPTIPIAQALIGTIRATKTNGGPQQ